MIRGLEFADRDAVLTLNALNEVETSPLDHARLDRMLEQSFCARVIGVPVRAFLIAFDETADYTSPNFLWFRARVPRFAYVDRIVVAESARGQGLARSLYEDVFSSALVAGHDCVVCEVNSDPPNPVSDVFHARLAFREIGHATLENGKTVRYLQRSLI